jgi:LysR family transcriptional regulator, cell division regulator
MDIDDLRIVTAVAKHGSMNRAAAELHMVQSAVTARIRSLEEELGVELFVRHSRGVQLSEAGKRLLSFTDRIDSLFKEAIASVKEDGVPKGILRVGSTEPTASIRLPQVVADYAAKYPAVALTITTGNSVDLVEQVSDRILDGAFVAGPVDRSGLAVEPIFREELVLMSHPSVQDLNQLAQSKDAKAIVLAHACSYRERLSSILDANGIAHQVLSFASFDAIRNCVQSGVGVTLVPRAFLASVWKDAPVKAHLLSGDAGRAETVFVRRSNSRPLSALDAFLAMTRASSNLQETA